ncbi:TraM recognition domain-containing protein [Vibrio fluvialis]|nr:TraM recognition domain-containing protein [Vibrio fluvialis]MBY7902422.1 TraM recognition domain-containing protein [Vibrio fluvialis]
MAKQSSFKEKARFGMRTGLFENKSKNIDARPLWVKLLDYFPLSIPWFFALFAFLILFMPTWSYFFYLFSCGFVVVAIGSQFQFMLHEPILLKKKLEMRLYDDKGQKVKTDDYAFMLIGYDLLFGRQLWLSVDRETRMTMISGTTGSGKTVTQNAQIFQAALQGHFPAGAPVLQIDGKGSVEGGFDFIFYYVRAGRLHDIRVLNFNTGGVTQDIFGMLDVEFTSHKFNPFSMLNKEESRGLVMSYGRSSEGGNSEFFRDRASTMLAGIFAPLTYKRDVFGEPLDSSVILRFTELRNMFKLAIDKAIPTDVIRPLREYLKTLNGVTDSDFSKASVDEIDINSKAEEQHTYNRSMLSKTLAEMTDTLGHIFCSKGSDINLRNAIQHGQVVLVFLPTIEKEPDAMSELGRMMVGSLRPALMPLIGHKFQGTYQETVLSLPSNRIVPFRIYLDEVLNYYVRGIANFLSLLRSSMVAITLLGQSLKGFEDAGLSEARQSQANLNNILAFSTQDVFETLDWISKKLGKVHATRISQMRSSSWGGWMNSDTASYHEEELFTARDMSGADAMEGIYFYRSEVIPFRSATMFKDIKRDGQLREFYLTWFAELPNPTAEDVQSVKAIQGFLNGVEDQSMAPIGLEQSSTIVADFAERVAMFRDLAERSGSQFSSPLFPFMFALTSDRVADQERSFANELAALQSKANAKKALGQGDVDDRFVIDLSKPSVEIVNNEPLKTTEESEVSSDVVDESIYSASGVDSEGKYSDTYSQTADISIPFSDAQVNDVSQQSAHSMQVVSSAEVTPESMMTHARELVGLGDEVDSLLVVFDDDDDVGTLVPNQPQQLSFTSDVLAQQPNSQESVPPQQQSTVSLAHMLRSSAPPAQNPIASGENVTQASSSSSTTSEDDSDSVNETEQDDSDRSSSADDLINARIDDLLKEGSKITQLEFKEVSEQVAAGKSHYISKPHLSPMSPQDQEAFVSQVSHRIDESSQAVDDLLADMFGDLDGH